MTAFPADAVHMRQEPGTPSRPCDRCGRSDALPFHSYEYDRTECPLDELFPALAGHPATAQVAAEVSRVFLACASCHAAYRAHRRVHKHGKERRTK